MKAFKIFLAAWGWSSFISGILIDNKSHCIFLGLVLIFIVESIKFFENEKKSFTKK